MEGSSPSTSPLEAVPSSSWWSLDTSFLLNAAVPFSSSSSNIENDHHVDSGAVILTSHNPIGESSRTIVSCDNDIERRNRDTCSVASGVEMSKQIKNSSPIGTVKDEEERDQELDNKERLQKDQEEKQRRLSVLALGKDYAEIQSLLSQSANEDLVVEKLLTKFPTYGTNVLSSSSSLRRQQANSNTNNGKHIQSKDPHTDFWLGPLFANSSNRKTVVKKGGGNDGDDDDDINIDDPMLLYDSRNTDDYNDDEYYDNSETMTMSESPNNRRGADKPSSGGTSKNSHYGNATRKSTIEATRKVSNLDWDEKEQNMWRKSENTTESQDDEDQQESLRKQNTTEGARSRRNHPSDRRLFTRASFVNPRKTESNYFGDGNNSTKESEASWQSSRTHLANSNVDATAGSTTSSVSIPAPIIAANNASGAKSNNSHTNVGIVDVNDNSKATNVVVYDDRQYWMPDQLCKQCFACETPFTVFRRRHHCRLCGQVFCNACSAFFVPATVHQNNSISTSGTGQNTTSNVQATSPATTSTVRATQASPSAITQGASNTASSTVSVTGCSTVRVCKICYDQVMIQQKNQQQQQQQQQIFSPMQSDSKPYSVNRSTDDSKVDPDIDTYVLKNRLPRQQSMRENRSDADPDASHRRVFSDVSIVTGRRQLKFDAHAAATPEVAGRDSNHHENEKGNDLSIDSPETRGNKNDNSPSQIQHSSVEDGNRHLGKTAATHLQVITRELLRLHAPLLWTHNESNGHSDKCQQQGTILEAWIDKLLTLATRCCATVNPNVKKGDLLDIRPYVKVKVISGSTYQDCQYLSGVLFRKTVTHKKMAREVENPRLMLLSGGIEFTRAGTENRIASLETLFEQEDTYTEILVGKILKLQPNVLFIGRSASRKAQELLLAAGVVLVQQVKPTLLSRIARQTGATIISSTDHVMNRFGPNVLGKCHRFRLVVFRDNEIWTDHGEDNVSDPVNTSAITVNGALHSSIDETIPVTSSQTVVKSQACEANQHRRKYIKALLADPTVDNHERQAALAANQLGEGFIDGSEAVKSGLAKRGVAHTYIMLEGCPKHLGCTVVLRGASFAALKQVKIVFRFLANIAYNLKLETCYLRERGARIRPTFQEIPEKHTFSSSLCVDYGNPPGGRKVRPWNGGNGTNDSITGVPRSDHGEITAFDHQSILIASVWMTDKAQCCPAEVKGICYYSLQDVSLGQFLRDSCFNLSLKCQNPNCKKSVLDHTLSFVHNDGLIKISVEEMEERLPKSPLDSPGDDVEQSNADEDDGENDRPIATWTYCQNCRKVVTPLVYISENTWKWSFGKFLEVFFYNRDAALNAPDFQCSCQLQTAATLYYGCGKLAARFTYERIAPYGVFVRRCLPIDFSYHRKAALDHLGVISVSSSELFVRFDKHIEKVSREARLLFNSAINRPEHLQTVLSELNRIGSEVDHAAKTLLEKIVAITDNCRRHDELTINAALFRFPWFARRYLFNLTSAWNEKLRYAGQAISAMKKIATAATRSEIGLGPNVTTGDPYNEELTEGMKSLRQLIDHYANLNITDITQVLPSFPGTSTEDVVNEAEYDDDFDDPESTIDFPDGLDADVLASRRRLHSKIPNSEAEKVKSVEQRPSKSLGTRRSLTDLPRLSQSTITNSTSHDTGSLSGNAIPKSTPGGAVKSAITRFFNRGGRDYEHYIVPLGIFTEGRPRLAPGVNGIILPVRDEQLSTIIAYSLASTEYANQFRQYSRPEGTSSDFDEIPSLIERNRKIKPELDAGIENHDTLPIDERSGHSTKNQAPSSPSSQQNKIAAPTFADDFRENERRMLRRNKSHIKHTFRDVDEKGQVSCKFVCTTYWATQFHAVRQVFLSPSAPAGISASGNNTSEKQNSCFQSGLDVEQSYIESLCSAESLKMTGGKSGASFARTSDDRFVIKCISRTELQMFLDCAPAYFEYLTKAFFHGLPTVLCKIVGVYQIGVHNKVTGKRSLEQVAVMQNIFYKRRITKIFDLKGSLRGRFALQKEDMSTDTPIRNKKRTTSKKSDGRDQNDTLVDGELGVHQTQQKLEAGPVTLLDGDFLEFTMGRPMPLTDRARAVFQMSILNDTLFLSIINVLDYSILIGIDEDSMELVVGMIDFMRQYDILKQMERVGKSLPMVVGSEAPTIIQPPLYKARFTNAMERYFMTVPSKWTTI